MEFSPAEIQASPLNHFISDILSRPDAEDYHLLVWSLLFFDRFEEDTIAIDSVEYYLLLCAIAGLTDLTHLDPEALARCDLILRMEEIADMLDRDSTSEGSIVIYGIEVILDNVKDLRIIEYRLRPAA